MRLLALSRDEQQENVGSVAGVAEAIGRPDERAEGEAIAPVTPVQKKRGRPRSPPKEILSSPDRPSEISGISPITVGSSTPFTTPRVISLLSSREATPTPLPLHSPEWEQSIYSHGEYDGMSTASSRSRSPRARSISDDDSSDSFVRQAAAAGESVLNDALSSDDEWGRDAIMSFEPIYVSSDAASETASTTSEIGIVSNDGAPTLSSGSSRSGSPVASIDGSTYALDPNVVREKPSALKKRGMPDYATWEKKDLQNLVEGYGYRAINVKTALVKVAMECWASLNPPPPILPPEVKAKKGQSASKKKTTKATKSSDESDGSSITSADVPLAKVKRGTRTTLKEPKVPQTQKSKKEKAVGPEEKRGGAPAQPLNYMKEFEALIREDKELHLRILRYEVSRSLPPDSLRTHLSRSILTS